MSISKINVSTIKRSEWKHPFDVQVQRFHHLGIHPALFRTRPNDRTPCDYDPKPSRCIRKPNINSWQPWQIEHESQEFSKNFGYEHGGLLALRNFMRKQLGPGSHDINMALYKQAEVSPCMNQNLGKQERFRHWDVTSPGPARYFVKPYAPKVTHVGCTIGNTKRFEEFPKPWSLPCNRYKVIHPKSIEALLNKVTTTRGPYDLFTGPRDPQNIFNKFSVGKRCTPDKFYSWPSNMDSFLRHPRNKVRGRFGKAERFLQHPISRHMLNNLTTCYHDPKWPSPAEYVFADGIKEAKEVRNPFRISGMEVRPGEKWKISPGPGRYNIRPAKCLSSTKNRTSVFQSKTKRTEYKAPIYNSF